MAQMAEECDGMTGSITVPYQVTRFAVYQIGKVALASQLNQFPSDNLSINYRASISLDGAHNLLA
jgi:hypothetical protein